DRDCRSKAFEMLVDAYIAKRDFQKAQGAAIWIQGGCFCDQSKAFYKIAEAMATDDPAGAIKIAARITDDYYQSEAFLAIFKIEAQKDFEKAQQTILVKIKDPDCRISAIRECIEIGPQDDLTVAKGMARKLETLKEYQWEY